MRILLVGDWNPGRGGTEAYALLLRDALEAAGDEIRLLTSSAGTRADGRADYVAFGTSNVAAQVFLQIGNPFAAATVSRAIKEFRPDAAVVVSFAHHLSPLVLWALGKTPTLLMVTDYKLTCPLGTRLLPGGEVCHAQSGWICHTGGCLSFAHWLRDQPRYALIRSALSRAAGVVACGPAVAEDLAAAGFPSRALWTPLAEPGPDYSRSRANQPLFLYCGRLEREKGVPVLLSALSLLQSGGPSAHLRIAGSGGQRPQLEALATSLGIANCVHFLGWLAPSEIEQQMAEAWAVVMPSLWAEPQGMVAVEAILRGVPVIASSIGGLGALVEEGQTGLLFPAGDVNALLRCLTAIAGDTVFSGQGLSIEAMQQAAVQFNVAHHVSQLRQMLVEVKRT